MLISRGEEENGTDRFIFLFKLFFRHIHYRFKISDPVRFDKKSSLQSQNYSGDLFEICLILSLNIYIVP